MLVFSKWQYLSSVTASMFFSWHSLTQNFHLFFSVSQLSNGVSKGNFPAVQWLGLGAFTAGAWVWSLVWKLRSLNLWGQSPKIKIYLLLCDCYHYCLWCLYCPFSLSSVSFWLASVVLWKLFCIPVQNNNKKTPQNWKCCTLILCFPAPVVELDIF